MIVELESAPRILISGELGAPGDLDGRALVLEAAALGETGILRVDGPRCLDLWFEDGRPTYGRADGLVGLDGRLETAVAAERFAEAERRARFGTGLAAELADAGVPRRQLREALRALVLDLLKLVIGATGDYRFEVGPLPYPGAPWIDLDPVLEPVATAAVSPGPPPRPAGVAVSAPAAPAGHGPLVAQSMPADVVAVRLDPNLWVVALALAEPRTVDAVVERTGLSSVAVTEAVHRLRRAGLVGDALAGLRDSPAAALRHPISGQRRRDATLVVADGHDDIILGIDGN